MGSHANDFAIFYVQVEIAANAAKGAGCSDFFVGAAFLTQNFFRQRPDGAGCDTGAAKYAIRLVRRGIERRPQFCIEASIHEAKHVADLQFLASSYATAT